MIDGVVLRVCNQGLLGPDDFEPDPERGGLRLRSQALRVFLQALETRFAQAFRPPRFAERRPLSQWLVEQAYQLARRLREGRPGFTGLGFRA